MPELKVVIFFGGAAQRAGRLLERTHPGILAARGIKTFGTNHTSRQALWTPSTAERTRREEDVLRTLAEAAAIIA